MAISSGETQTATQVDAVIGSQGVKETADDLAMFGAVAKGAAAGGVLVYGAALASSAQEIMKFEQELAGLQKILGEQEAMPIAESVADMTKRLPQTRRELMLVAENAARLGIRGRENILGFTETIAKLDVATTLTAEVASKNLARIAEATGLPISKLNALGNAINELSNTAATDASEIVQSLGRIAPTAQQIGDTSIPQLLAISTALNEVNISVRRGSRQLRSFFQQALDPGKAEDMANAIGLNVQEFNNLLHGDTADAHELLVRVVKAMNSGGESAKILRKTLRNSARAGVTKLANALDGLNEHLDTANTHFSDTSDSLQDEFNVFMGTAVNRAKLLRNRINELQREMGRDLLDDIHNVISATSDLIDEFEDLQDANPFTNITSEEHADDLRQISEELGPRVAGVYDDLWQRWARGLDTANRGFDMFRESTGFLGKIPGLGSAFFGTLQNITDELGNAEQPARRLEQRLMATFKDIPDGELRQQFAAELEALASTIQGKEQIFDPITGKVVSTTKFARRWLNKLIMDYRAMGDEAGQAGDDAGDAGDTGAEGAKTQAEAVEQLIQKLREEREEAERGRLGQIKLTKAWEQATPVQRDYIRHLVAMNDTFDFLRRTLDLSSGGVEKLEEVFDNAKESTEITNSELQRMRRELIRLGESGWSANEMLFWLKKRVRDAGGTVEDKLQVFRELGNTMQMGNIEFPDFDDTPIGDDEYPISEKKQERIDEYQKAVNRFDMTSMQAQMDMLSDVTQQMTDSFFAMFDALIDETKDVEDAIVDMIRNISQQLASSIIQRFLFKTMATAFKPNSEGGIPSPQKLPSGGPTSAASGGHLSASEVAIVGELGPELFIPDSAGSVIPNDQIGNFGSSTTVNRVIKANIHFNVKAMDSRDVQRMLDENKELITDRVVEGISKSQGRRRQLM